MWACVRVRQAGAPSWPLARWSRRAREVGGGGRSEGGQGATVEGRESRRRRRAQRGQHAAMETRRIRSGAGRTRRQANNIGRPMPGPRNAGGPQARAPPPRSARSIPSPTVPPRPCCPVARVRYLLRGEQRGGGVPEGAPVAAALKNSGEGRGRRGLAPSWSGAGVGGRALRTRAAGRGEIRNSWQEDRGVWTWGKLRAPTDLPPGSDPAIFPRRARARHPLRFGRPVI